MKKILSLLFILLSIFSAQAQELVRAVEAENGTLMGVYTAGPEGASSGQYVTGFDTDGDKLTIMVDVPTTGTYDLVMRYRAASGDKTNDLYVNGAFTSGVNFLASADFVNLAPVPVMLNSGSNTLEIRKSWGYFDLDMFSVFTKPPNTYNITTILSDTQVTNKTQNLYDFIKSQYRQKIMTGQTSDYYESIVSITGKNPLIRSFDLMSYSPMYAYKWDNACACHTLGAVDPGVTESIIDWYNGTGQKGIVEIHWHWFSPSGGQAGTNTFYTTETTFDVSQAVISGTQENSEVLRDIDAIAIQLKKIRDAGVPVIWRPLHEAGGGWFWWGAKGPEAGLALYDIVRDRLMNYHGIHNLIWVWSTPETDWYPGNSKVDMLGFDSYPGAYNYTIQKPMFDANHNLSGGTKMVAMTENGAIPDLVQAIDLGAPWSFFCGWNELTTDRNTSQHIIDMYHHPYALTLENCPSYQDGNNSPSASFTYTTAGLLVDFDGSGSVDSDGTIISWNWNFGDGSNGSGGVVSHTYASPGDYTISLTVSDEGGATGVTSQVVSVSDGSGASMHVQRVVAFSESVGKGSKRGVAEVTIHDDQENPLSGATVTGNFTGAFNEIVSGTTGTDGIVAFHSSQTAKGGITVDFCVNNVDHSTITYDPNLNDQSCSNEPFLTEKVMWKRDKERPDTLIFPNPAEGEVYINLTQYKNAEVGIQLLDVNGKKLLRSQTAGGGIFLLSTSGLQSGFYLVLVESQTKSVYTKLLLK